MRGKKGKGENERGKEGGGGVESWRLVNGSFGFHNLGEEDRR